VPPRHAASAGVQPRNRRAERSAGGSCAGPGRVWRVAKFCVEDSTGRLSEPYGQDPIGYFIYTPSGHLAIQLMRTPLVRPFAGGDDWPTDAERRGLLDAYMAYFGTYAVTSDSTVVHRVEAGTLPSYIGTNQPRVYRIRGDTLTIGGSTATWPCRVLVRAG
jgi:hypothetical protein